MLVVGVYECGEQPAQCPGTSENVNRHFHVESFIERRPMRDDRHVFK
jgi:hypothetical protein